MRPRLLHLGSKRILGCDPIDFRRFNEAEAFTPRIRFGCAARNREKVELQ